MTSSAKTPRLPFDLELVRAVCDILAQTDYPGITGSDIDRLLQGLRISGRESGANKREGLLIALYNAQLIRSGGLFIEFVDRAMSPIRYASGHSRFEELRG